MSQLASQVSQYPHTIPIIRYHTTATPELLQEINFKNRLNVLLHARDLRHVNHHASSRDPVLYYTVELYEKEYPTFYAFVAWKGTIYVGMVHVLQ